MSTPLYESSIKSLPLLTRGKTITIRTPAYAEENFPAQIASVADFLDPVTRTIKARVTLANASRKLKGEMFVTAEIDTGGATMSAPATIFVSRRPQAITFTPPSSTVAASSVTLDATASSGLPVTLAIVSGSATLGGRVLTGAGGPVVVRATQGGNGNYEPATAVDRTINFVAGAISPFLTVTPADQTVLASSNVTLRALSIGTPAPAYQWSRNGVAIPGATAANLNLTNVTLGVIWPLDVRAIGSR